MTSVSPMPDTTTDALIGSVAARLQNHLTVGERERNFDSRGNFSQKPRSTHITAVPRPSSASMTMPLRRASSSSVASVSSVSSYGSENAQQYHERDVRKRLQDQVNEPDSRRSASSRSRACSAVSASSSRPRSAVSHNSQYTQRRRSETAPGLGHKLSSGEAQRLLNLASKLVVATETVAMVPVPKKSSRHPHIRVPTSVRQLSRGADALEKRIQQQQNHDTLDSESSTMTLDSLDTKGSETSLASTVESARHRRRHTSSAGRGQHQSRPSVKVSPPSSQQTTPRHSLSQSQPSIPQQQHSRKSGHSKTSSQRHPSSGLPTNHLKTYDPLRTRSDTTLIFESKRTTRRPDPELAAGLQDSPYRTRMNLASGSHVASSSSLRGSNTALLSGKQSGLPQRGTKLSAAAAPHHESVGMATQTVEDKAIQSANGNGSSTADRNLSGTHRQQIVNNSHLHNSNEAGVQASTSSLHQHDAASSSVSLGQQTSAKKPKHRSHSFLVKEAAAMLEKLQALVQFEVEVYTGEIVPLYSKDNELLITLCGVDRSTEELPLETETDEAPELASNAKHSFNLHCEDVGSLRSIRFRHTSGDGWLPEKIVLRRLPESKVSYVFDFSSHHTPSTSTVHISHAEVADPTVQHVNSLPCGSTPGSYNTQPGYTNEQMPTSTTTNDSPSQHHYNGVVNQQTYPHIQQQQLQPAMPFQANPTAPVAGPYGAQFGGAVPATGQYGPQSGQIVMTPLGPMAWLPTASPPHQQQAVDQAPIGLEGFLAADSQKRDSSAQVSINEDAERDEQVRMDTFLEGFRVGVEATKKTSSSSEDAVIPPMRQLTPEGDNIHEATMNGDLDRIRLMLDKSTHWLSTLDEDGMLPVHCAASTGQLDSLKTLSSYDDIDLEATTATGYTALHCATMHGHVRCMKLLGALGCSINCRTIDRQTPLHLAAANGHLECCKWLVANRAKLKIKDSQGRKPKKVARENGYTVVAEFLESCQEEISRGTGALNLLRTPNAKSAGGEGGVASKSAPKQSRSFWQSDEEAEVLADDKTPAGVKSKKKERRTGHHKLDNHTSADLQEHYDKQHKKMEASDKSFLDVVRQEVEGSAAEE